MPALSGRRAILTGANALYWLPQSQRNALHKAGAIVTHGVRDAQKAKAAVEKMQRESPE